MPDYIVAGEFSKTRERRRNGVGKGWVKVQDFWRKVWLKRTELALHRATYFQTVARSSFVSQERVTTLVRASREAPEARFAVPTQRRRLTEKEAWSVGPDFRSDASSRERPPQAQLRDGTG